MVTELSHCSEKAIIKCVHQGKPIQWSKAGLESPFVALKSYIKLCERLDEMFQYIFVEKLLIHTVVYPAMLLSTVCVTVYVGRPMGSWLGYNLHFISHNSRGAPAKMAAGWNLQTLARQTLARPSWHSAAAAHIHPCMQQHNAHDQFSF